MVLYCYMVEHDDLPHPSLKPDWGHIKEGDIPLLTKLRNGYTDPVYFVEGKWGFFDDLWSDSFGPFETREDAETWHTVYVSARKRLNMVVEVEQGTLA